jgi:hypothetical protein
MASGVIPIPSMIVPVTITFPSSPMTMKIVVVDSMIAWWHVEDIIRRYNDDRCRNETYLDRNPGIGVSDSSKPMPPVETIPVASIKIKTYRTWDHINIAWPTGNYHHFGWSRKCDRWWNTYADANLYLCYCRDR